MKNLQVIVLLYMALVFTSCAELYKFIQVFETQSADDTSPLSKYGNGLVYENNDCAIYYYLWSERGDASFMFSNKTDKIIYLDLKKSFFIRNGIANDYYKERTWEERTWKTNNSSVISIKEQPIIAIPPKSDKIVKEYTISDNLYLYKDCDLERFPEEKSTISFTKEDSPLSFENYLTYRIEDSDKDVVVENKFYVSQITNYSLPYINKFVEREEKPCQNMTDDDSKNYNVKYPVKVFDKVITINTYNCFYIEYDKWSSRHLYKKNENYYYYYNNQYEGYTRGE